MSISERLTVNSPHAVMGTFWCCRFCFSVSTCKLKTGHTAYMKQTSCVTSYQVILPWFAKRASAERNPSALIKCLYKWIHKIKPPIYVNVSKINNTKQNRDLIYVSHCVRFSYTISSSIFFFVISLYLFLQSLGNYNSHILCSMPLLLRVRV